MSLSSDENQVKTREKDEDAADFFENDRSFGFLVPVHISLDKFGACAGKNYNRAVPHAINHEQDNTISKIC